ncbi:uncharacterized protein LOC131172670 [Hevea brasiliensis]|uniref:uncharacterized protein LOC131172670 n=1 Tax=Hevea brasiliensis TaxID=3981 RepID=UPI0025D7BA2D|nr:uncharacterized protein LOC131172670 [Hevea brasiliensis]XP_057990133.1 uncharacterized protein LOC131172670 [Hevea brasiliensis]
MHLLKKKVVKLCIFGDEVPQRMRYKNQIGSSLSFTLDQPNLIGFSFCAVCDPKNFLGDDMADITCEAQFIDKSGHSNKKFHFDWVTVKDVNLLCSEHVFLWNDSFDMEDGPVAASFQFFVDRVFVKAKYRKDRDYSAIIKCGVHPIFGDDCLGRDNKKRSRSQEDEDDELSFQRLKQDQEPSHTLDKSDSE